MIVWDGWHILNGDALREKFIAHGITTSVITMREALIEGPAQPEVNNSFFEKRANYISQNFDGAEHEYDLHVVRELVKLESLESHSEINLWFENDLFCQVNLWFILKYLQERGKAKKLFRIIPPMHPV